MEDPSTGGKALGQSAGVHAPPRPVELLYWEGCPSHDRALRELNEAMSQLSIAETVEVRKIETMADAIREAFVGSPTIRIHGNDIVDPADEPVALTCRVYRRRNGNFTPVPDPDDLRAALQIAFASQASKGSISC